MKNVKLLDVPLIKASKKTRLTMDLFSIEMLGYRCTTFGDESNCLQVIIFRSDRRLEIKNAIKDGIKK